MSIEIIERAIVSLASVCDRASDKDDKGYNGRDAEFGHSLASQAGNKALSPNQLNAAFKMLQTYRKQLQGMGIELPESFTASVATEVKAETPKPSSKISLQGKAIIVTFPYNPEVVARVKTVSGAKWNSDSKFWQFPFSAAADLITAFPDFEVDPTIASEVESAQSERLAELAIAQADYQKLVNAANVSAPLANGRSLYQHQKEAALWSISQIQNTELRGAIMALDMGLGKTLVSLVVAKAYHQVFQISVFVVCPASLKENWLREAEMVGVAIEVFSWAKMPKPLEVSQYFLICDECFVKGTKIRTNAGLIDIKDIVESCQDAKILSFNFARNALEYKKIERWIKKKYSGLLIKVNHEFGSFVCTPNHRIFTKNNGYIRADELRSKDRLQMVRKPNTQGIILLKEVFCTTQSFVETEGRTPIGCLPELQTRISLSQEWEITSRRNQEILRQDLLKPIQFNTSSCNKNKSSKRDLCPEWAEGKEISRMGAEDERAESNAQSRSISKDDQFFERKDVLSKRWEWCIDRTTKEPFFASRRRLDNGVFNSDSLGHTSFSITSNLLQGGSRESISQDCNRGRWEHAQTKEVEVLRQKEDGSIECSGVESIEVLEQGSDEHTRYCDEQNLWVYNLEVADNNNYFANDVLVSNCHYAQAGSKSARGKAFIELGTHENCKGSLALTGTPIKNGRPINLFPLLKATNHELAKNKRDFESYFCAAKPTRFCPWDVSGAAHLDELHARTKDVMFRRTKAQCLDLPSKTRVMRSAEVTGDALKVWKQAFGDAQQEYEENRGMGKGEALVLLGKLRKAASTAKIETAIEMASDNLEEGQQVVIFSEFLDTAKELHRQLGGELLIGETAVDDRQGLVDRFQSGQSKVFISTSRAGGVGITLTAAQTVILVDRPWTPGDAMQCEDRCHRIGQSGNVSVYWLQWSEIDEKVDAILEQKQERIELILEGKRKTLRGIGSPADIAQELCEDILRGKKK